MTEQAIQRVEARPVSELFRLAKAFAASGYFADAQEMAQAIVKIQAGRELGIPAFQAMSSFHIVKGKPVVSANLMAAAIRRHADYDYRVVEHTDAKCSIEFTRGGAVIGVSTFTMDDARRAGLVKTDSNWSRYPKNMLFARSLSNGCKWYCPDVFVSPIYVPDELGMAVDGETLEALPLETPAAEAKAIPKPPATVYTPATREATAAPATPATEPTAPPAAEQPAAPTNPPADAAAPPAAAAPGAEHAKLFALIEQHCIADDLIERWKKYFKVPRLEDLASEQVARLIAKIEEKTG